jgi:hypothetical protein
MGCDGSVTAGTLAGDGCDGCDGFFKSDCNCGDFGRGGFCNSGEMKCD